MGGLDLQVVPSRAGEVGVLVAAGDGHLDLDGLADRVEAGPVQPRLVDEYPVNAVAVVG